MVRSAEATPLFPLTELGSAERLRGVKPTQRPLSVAGLFAGVGGVELGLKRSGHEAQILCEIEPAAAAVLQHRFKGVPLAGDVTELKTLPKGIELLTGGFPCQDLSQAGKTAGILNGSRSGLVSEVFRLVKKHQMPWVLLENVPFMLKLDGGNAMRVLTAAFEALGYRWAYRVINSLAFGVPQRRERVIFLASNQYDPRDVIFADEVADAPLEQEPIGRVACGFYWTEGVRGLGWAVDSVPTLKGGSTIGIPSPPAILFPDGMIGTPDIRDAERMQGFPSNWTKPAEQVSRASHRWKLVGNAVTVDLFEWVGRRLRSPDPAGRSCGGWSLEGRPGGWPVAGWNVGAGRFGTNLSALPKRKSHKPLEQWLKFPIKPLSLRATDGFLSRTEISSLRFPKGFIEAVRRHQALMSRLDQTSV